MMAGVDAAPQLAVFEASGCPTKTARRGTRACRVAVTPGPNALRLAPRGRGGLRARRYGYRWDADSTAPGSPPMTVPARSGSAPLVAPPLARPRISRVVDNDNQPVAWQAREALSEPTMSRSRQIGVEDGRRRPRTTRRASVVIDRGRCPWRGWSVLGRPGTDAADAVRRDMHDSSGRRVVSRWELRVGTEVDVREFLEELRPAALGDPGPPIHHEILLASRATREQELHECGSSSH